MVLDTVHRMWDDSSLKLVLPGLENKFESPFKNPRQITGKERK